MVILGEIPLGHSLGYSLQSCPTEGQKQSTLKYNYFEFFLLDIPWNICEWI